MPTFHVRCLMMAALIIGLAGACRSPVETEGTVTAAFEGPGIKIENGTRHRIYFRAVEGEAVPAVSWVPCGDPNTCPSIRPGSAVVVPMSFVHGVDEPADVVHVLWWRLVPDPGQGAYRMPELNVTFARR